MAADIISGIGGAVDGENCVSRWKTERISTPAAAVCSASGGSIVRGSGVMDWRGMYTGYGHTPANLPGDTFQFTGGTSGGYGATTVANGAIGSRTDIKWDVEGGGFIEYANYFEAATGALTYGAASATDSSTPNPSATRSCTLNLTGCTELRKMVLTLLSHNAKAVTANTAGRVERVAGPKDAQFQAKIYTKTASFPAEEAVSSVLFGVGSGQSWTMTNMIITLVAPLLPLGGGLFEADIAGSFTGYSSGSKGSVTSPGGTVWWS